MGVQLQEQLRLLISDWEMRHNRYFLVNGARYIEGAWLIDTQQYSFTLISTGRLA